MQLTLNNIFFTISLVFMLFSVSLWYNIKKESDTSRLLITQKLQEAKTKEIVEAVEEEKLLNKKQLWTDLQQKAKNTVVQVFAQIIEFNWIEPYKTPTQSEATGTAFFINNEGELITNAHVVDQARYVCFQVPGAGKKRFEVDVIGVSPERDLALLKIKPKDFENLKKELKKDTLPFLKLGDSDSVTRADKLMALGYPLGMQGLKSTTGVVSGREHLSGQHFIQISAALNKGNSGGPSLNNKGEVIGVNSAIIQNAQNVGYIIPINEVKLFLEQLRALPDQKGPKLIHKPFLGVLFSNADENLTELLGNPQPGGLYVVEVYNGSPLNKAGIEAGDMIYKINGFDVDVYGEMNVPWSTEDRVSIVDYVSRLKLGQDINIEFYRKGVLKKASIKFAQSQLPPIRRAYPGYEKMDYEIIGGLVVMQLTLNHVLLLAQYAPDLMQYADMKKHKDPALIITNVLLNSPASKSRSLLPGSVISQVNGQKVKTLEDFKKALLKSKDSGYITIRTAENIFVALPLKDVMSNELELSQTYFYQLSDSYNRLHRELGLDKLKPS